MLQRYFVLDSTLVSHPYTEVGGSGGKNLAKPLSCVIPVVFAHSECECEDVKRLAFLTRGGKKVEDRSRERLEGSKHYIHRDTVVEMPRITPC